MTATSLQNARSDSRPARSFAWVSRQATGHDPLDAYLQLLDRHVQVRRRILHAGDKVYSAGETFDCLHIVHSGSFKVVGLADDGRDQVVALHLKGDWLGLDGIADGVHGCDAIAMDVGEVWTFRYDALLGAGLRCPQLLPPLHAACGRQIDAMRDWMMSHCSLPVDARVAEFLRHWIDALASRGLRTDQITLRLTRAEIGSFLGMTLESVSRALNRMAREEVIRFEERGRRDIHIPDVAALDVFRARCSMPSASVLQ